MDISIITVNFRSRDHLERMVTSVLKYTKGVSYEVIVVNNDPNEQIPLRVGVAETSLPRVTADGAPDDAQARDTRAEHQRGGRLAGPAARVRVINNPHNLGFAAGCNVGIEAATGRYLVLLNPDIELVDDSLTTMVQHLDRDTDVGIAGPRLFYPDGTPQPSVRRFPGLLDQVLVLLKIPHLLANLGPINRYLHTDLDGERTQDVDQVMGAYFVIRRELLDDIGLMDEGFFYWYEEVDYCRRAIQAGWKVRYYADVRAQHVQAGSFSREKTIRKQAVIRRSLRRYARKHLGWKAYGVLVLLDPLFRVLALMAHVVKRR